MELLYKAEGPGALKLCKLSVNVLLYVGLNAVWA